MICKEEFCVFEQLEKEQDQLFPDSVDYGIRLRDIPDVDFVRQQLNELIKLHKHDRSYRARSWGNGKSVEMFIHIEYDEGVEIGYFLTVSFHSHKGGFITIEIKRGTRTQ